jgi:hypothetical protein
MPDITRTGPSTVLDFTGPQSLLDDTGPLVTGRRARPGDPRDGAPDEAAPDGRIAARHSSQADPGDADMLPRSRRRGAWRKKGTDVDQELWPAEAFGGVSDEQFWNDMAADRPLATTARTAQPAAGARRRPPAPGRLPDLPAPGLGRPAAAPKAAGGTETPSPSRPGPNDQTATQPAVPAMPPSPPATRPVRAAAPAAGSPGPSHTATGAGEDPLTSPAYALRPQGAVNGHPGQPSNRPRSADGGNTGRRRPEPPRPDRSWPASPSAQPPRPAPPSAGPAYRPGAGDGYGNGTAHLYSQQPSGGPVLPASTPPYGERSGYPNQAAGQGSPGSDPRYANGGWNRAQQPGNGEASWGTRPVYPPGHGYQAPYDPRGQDRR